MTLAPLLTAPLLCATSRLRRAVCDCDRPDGVVAQIA